MLKRVINAVRRNHALEHATISILLNRHGPMRLVGRAVPDGFYIYGDIPTERLRELADEALTRLQRGEADLAVSPAPLLQDKSRSRNEERSGHRAANLSRALSRSNSTAFNSTSKSWAAGPKRSRCWSRQSQRQSSAARPLLSKV